MVQASSGSGAVKRGAAGYRDKMKGTLQAKTEQSYKSKDDNASTFRDYFDKDKMEGVKVYRVPKGDVTVVLDIIPYLAGKNDPKNAEGDPVYVLDLMVHKNIGPMNDQIVCLTQYGKPCPSCEEVAKRNAASEDYDARIKPLKASRRVLYNVIIRDNGEAEKKGNQVYETAHFFMEKKLVGITKNPRTGGITVFSDPDDGKSVSFTKRNPTKNTVDYSAYQFVDRPCPITDEELAATKSLDELVKILSYAEHAEILYAVAETAEGNEQEAPPRNEPKAGSEPEQQEAPPRAENKRQRPAPEADSNVVCPVAGGTVGVSIDELDECMSCTLYNQCSAIAEKLDAA